jgi:hypothetical protein
MIRLTHQFDDPRTRPSAAAPKSAACSSCCCCCLATMLGASILTARSVGHDFKPRPVGSTELEAAGPESVFRPSGPDVPVPNMRTMPRWGWKVVGFFLLPLSLFLPMLLIPLGAGSLAIPLMLAMYIGGLFFLRHKAGLPGWVIIVLIASLPFLTIGESVVWLFLGFK